ncbi:type II secretion system minor pseudopilin GspK [Beggiatoa leptomitoformis]|uniref:Type II secretion system protein K n=1 Tax=Beggiatoa leptomitoformis TaxID=288004 RepID=A0A2N9YJL3_9GAMM|nr:type II secretion system minor pseudopilin GspK [Beggiatoa leptomitoformis]ALG69427.2 type II secretion system minor pseudopilin GspK [Beggiatoa leptomitoformis]AUI70654.2 type II secretion system minor pseudopilin GspK [Beggiatoa leptomitoformis]
MRIPQQRGVALITAILIVALATVVAVAITTRQQLDIRRTANVLNTDQAYLYALSGETWAAQILRRDSQNSKYDALTELWAVQLPPFPIEGGTLQGQLTDLQGLFNINSLIDEKGKVVAEQLARFQRLLRYLEISPNLAQAVVDWIDGDNDPQLPNGAEETTYLINKPAYRAANALMSSPTELRLVTGFKTEIYNKLIPYVTALPEATTINVNTAPLPVLMALAEDLPVSQIEGLVKNRETTPFKTLQEFLTHEAFAGIKLETQGLGVTTSYFRYQADVYIERGRSRLTSILQRSETGIITLARSQEPSTF